MKRYVPSDGEPKSLRGAWITVDDVPGYTDDEIGALRDELGEELEDA